MAISSMQGQEVLDALATLIKQKSGGSFTQERAFGETRGKTDGDAPGQEILDASRNNSKSLKAIEQTFKQMATKGLNAKELEKLPANIKKSLEDVGSESAKKMADSINNMGDVLQVQKQIKANEHLVTTLQDLKGEKQLSLEGYERIQQAADAVGVSMDSLISKDEEVVANFDDLARETEEMSSAFKDATNKTTRGSRAVNTSTVLFGQHSAKLKESLGLFIEETKLARERGAWDAKYIDAIVGMGVSMKAWTQVLADNRGVQQAMATGGRDFTAEMKSGSNQLVRYSKDNEQALKTTAAFSDNIASLGVNQKNLGGALDEQVKMYEDNFFIYGVTAEAFAESTKQLLADTDVRSSLAMMQEDQRKEYILGIQAQEASRMALGYTTEQARELTKVFAKMGAESPKERMKKAAKMRALAGSMGMGAEGAELQEIMVNINQKQGPERAKALKRAEEIQRSMSNKIQQRYGQGLGSEMVTRAMVDKAGFNEMSKTLQTLTQQGKIVDKDQAAAAATGREVPYMLSKGLQIWDTISAFQGSSVGILTSILGLMLKMSFSKGAQGSLLDKVGKSGGGKWGAAKAVGSMAAKTLGPLTAIVAGFSKYSEVADDASLTGSQKAVQVGSTAAGAGGGMIAGAMTGAAIGAMGGPIGIALGGLIGGAIGAWGGEELGEIVGESLSDTMDTPAMQKAAAEKLEKQTLAKTTDGLSTKDAKNLDDKAKEQSMLDGMVEGFVAMTTYFKEVNGQNYELADSTNNLATKIDESTRSSKFSASRPS